MEAVRKRVLRQKGSREHDAKGNFLRLRLPELEGKANKKERSAVNNEIYSLENDERYVAVEKARMYEAAKAQGDARTMTRLLSSSGPRNRTLQRGPSGLPG